MSFYAKQSTESGDFSLKIGEVSRDQVYLKEEYKVIFFLFSLFFYYNESHFYDSLDGGDGTNK
jgi:hypothetical protein